MRAAHVLASRALRPQAQDALLALFIASTLLPARYAHAQTTTETPPAEQLIDRAETTTPETPPAAQPLERDETTPEAPPTVRSLERIEVTGNTRTHPDVILRALGVKEGEPVSTEDVPELERRLINLRLFSAAKVALRPGASGVVLEVGVVERWTLLPVPFFNSSQGRTQAGLFLVETNLFGRRKQLAAGGTYSNRGSNGFVFYRDPSLGGSNWTLSASTFLGVTDRERVPVEVVLDSYRDARYEASAQLGYQLTRELNVSGGLFGRILRPKARDGFATAPPPGGEAYGVTASADYQGQTFRFFFNEGLNARLQVDEGLDLAGSLPYRRVQASATYTHAVLGDHTLSFSGSFELSHGNPFRDTILLGGRMGSRGFVQGGLWAEEATTFTAEYQLPLWKPGWGVLTANAFVDAGVARWQGDPLTYATPGAGLRVYLRNVAIPALGVDVTRAPTTHEVTVSVAAGVSL
ncbi:BamA/TamA family outer membrane protein [Hyalangium rubrum]|uniref:BamA/TamA family outer membrane protein n=1 Tax=Hyalangium rubrum TaxID=3103134 RepID=A0ABU5HHV7_9BACT|nr:BamA/TamA family outer membrane protein [Hyalangium sp. s54d21]MDY7233046.1 BamA/TamA family outer membrane protein [Hyalangium sp. s54d21]